MCLPTKRENSSCKPLTHARIKKKNLDMHFRSHPFHLSLTLVTSPPPPQPPPPPPGRRSFVVVVAKMRRHVRYYIWPQVIVGARGRGEERRDGAALTVMANMDIYTSSFAIFPFLKGGIRICDKMHIFLSDRLQWSGKTFFSVERNTEDSR